MYSELCYLYGHVVLKQAQKHEETHITYSNILIKFVILTFIFPIIFMSAVAAIFLVLNDQYTNKIGHAHL